MALSDLTVPLLVNTAGIHMKKDALHLIVLYKVVDKVHFLTYDELNGSIWPCENWTFFPRPIKHRADLIENGGEENCS